MRTEKQIEASRLNGAKSRGPVTDAGKIASAANSVHSTGPRTPEGKARSSRNAEKRQLLANSVAFPTEDSDEFLELLNDYREALSPVGFLEERVVETVSVCDWYRRRYWVLGMAKVGHATALQEKSADDFTNEMHNDIAAVQTALAVSKLADTGRALEYFRRCDTGYSREYLRARKELKELQTDRAKREERERLSRPPDFDIASCFVHSDDLAEEAKKYSQRSEPDVPFRGVSTGVPFRGAGSGIPFRGPATDIPFRGLSSGIPFRGLSYDDLQSWEPYSPPFVESADTTPSVSAGNHTVEDSIQQDDQADTQPVAVSDVEEPAPAVATEKITEQTEPKDILVGTVKPFQPPAQRARVPLLISCRGNIGDQTHKVTP